jgi:uncharacterized membrane protein
MKTWLSIYWESLRTNFWFMPTVMVAGAVVLSRVTINLDKVAADHSRIAALGWTFTRGPEGSRAVLSTVAGSMMTITSVTFSITIVALQLASSQFGPRLLRNFMRDRGNQVSLGTFIATFAYCLLILRTVNGTEGQQFVPHISVTVGLLLALTSLGVLIYFIHHAAASIQVENVIATVSRDLDQAIARLYPECLGAGPSGRTQEETARDVPAGLDRESRPVAAPWSGYLQTIDVDRLLGVAREHDLVIHVSRRPGKFLIAGGDLARAWPGDRVDDEVVGAIQGAFYLGPTRTLTQDIEFAIDQLVEIAVRALSPGVNDPFTAINCVDRLGASLVVLAGKEIPSAYRYDDERLRIVVDTSTIRGIVNAAFDQIRQAARNDAAVTIRLLETIAAVAAQARNDDLRAALRRQAEMVHRGGQEALPEEWDRREADERFRDVLRAIGEAGP